MRAGYPRSRTSCHLAEVSDPCQFFALLAVARHADIWHTNLQTLEEFRAATARVDDLAAEMGRDGSAIERSVRWQGTTSSADALRNAGATTFTTEIHPTGNGYDFAIVKQMLARRDAQQ